MDPAVLRAIAQSTIEAAQRQIDVPKFIGATVTTPTSGVSNDGLVQVKLDGDTAGNNVALTSIYQGSMLIGQRVLVLLSKSGGVILGPSGPAQGWQTYTPALTADSGSPAVGNGAVLGRYRNVGGLMHVRAGITLGSTTNFGTGNVYLSLPATHVTLGQRETVGVAEAFDLSATKSYICSVVPITPYAKVAFGPDGAVGLSGSAGVPFTWATGDTLGFSATIEPTP